MIDEIMSELKHEIEEHNADTFESKIFNSGILCAMGIVAKYGKCDNINRGCVDPINFNNRRLAENVSEDDGK